MAVLVSIVIDNYNYARFLPEAVDSALGQTYRPTEVIVVDDGSTDSSRSVLARYGSQIRTVYTPNRGQASAFNAGFRACRGQWVALLDADDRFESTKIETLMAAVSAYPSAGLVAHPLEYIDSEGQPLDPAPHVGSRPRTGLFDRRARVRRGWFDLKLPATSGLFFRRALLARILPMPVDIKITADNYLKMAAAALAPVAVIENCLGQQRLHGHNLYTGQDGTKEGRVQKELIAAGIRLNLAKKFPFLAPLAWGQYGKTMQVLRRHGGAGRVQSMHWLRSTYQPETWPMHGYLYAFVMFLWGYVRDAKQSILG